MRKKERERQEERQQAIEQLRKFLKPGDTIFTILRHTSKSGMTRDIDIYIVKDNEPVWLSGYARHVVGDGKSRDGNSIRVGGCGMDMGYHIVHNLGYALFPDGFDCTMRDGHGRDRCPSNDHSNGDDSYSDHHHDSGGYAFHHAWM